MLFKCTRRRWILLACGILLGLTVLYLFGFSTVTPFSSPLDDVSLPVSPSSSKMSDKPADKPSGLRIFLFHSNSEPLRDSFLKSVEVAWDRVTTLFTSLPSSVELTICSSLSGEVLDFLSPSSLSYFTRVDVLNSGDCIPHTPSSSASLSHRDLDSTPITLILRPNYHLSPLALEWVMRARDGLGSRGPMDKVAGLSLSSINASRSVVVPFSIQKVLKTVIDDSEGGAFVPFGERWDRFVEWTNRNRNENEESLKWESRFNEFCLENDIRVLFDHSPFQPLSLSSNIQTNLLTLSDLYPSLYDFSVPFLDLGDADTVSPEEIFEHEVRLMSHEMHRIESLPTREPYPVVAMATVINEAFVPTTRSWLCNARGMSNVLERVVVICVDVGCYRKISSDIILNNMKSKETFHILGLSSTLSTRPLRFGTAGYARFMLKRTRFWNELIHLNHSFFSFETDSFWQYNGFKGMFQSGKMSIPFEDADLIGCVERGFVMGGFFFVKANENSKNLFREIVVRFERELRRFGYVPPQGPIPGRLKNDQVLLTDLVLKEWGIEDPPRIRFSQLSNHFASGSTHPRDPEKGLSGSIIVIQNNFVVGVETKVERAKRFGYWFYIPNEENEDLWRCNETARARIVHDRSYDKR